jgi:hypothetical protein
MLIVSEEAERRYSRTRTANSSALHLTADLTIRLKGTEELEFRIRIRIGGVLIDGCYKPASANQQPPCLERMGARDSIALIRLQRRNLFHSCSTKGSSASSFASTTRRII